MDQGRGAGDHSEGVCACGQNPMIFIFEIKMIFNVTGELYLPWF
jgi:hypothetical protein